MPSVTGFLDRAFVLNGRDVPRILFLSHGLQHASHDLAAACLWQHVHKVQFSYDGDRPQFVTYLVEQTPLQFLRWGEALFQHDKCADHLSPQLVRPANDARLRDCGMAEESGLNFDGADAMSGYLDDLVGATRKPNIAIRVDLRRVPGVIDTGNDLPIIAAVSFFFTPQFRSQSGERSLDHHDAFFVYRARCTVECHHFGINARHGNRRAARLDGQHSQAVGVAEYGTAGFGLPHVIDNRNPVFENLFLHPFPSWRI